jgi:hypothetical protein
MCFPTGLVPLPSHLTSCTPTKSNSYFNTSSKLSLGSPPYTNPLQPIIQISSIFHHLGHLSQESVRFWGSVVYFVTNLFFLRWRVVSPTPNP